MVQKRALMPKRRIYYCGLWRKAYQWGLKEDAITEDPKENPINEKPKEDPVTVKPKDKIYQWRLLGASGPAMTSVLQKNYFWFFGNGIW